MTPPPTPDGSPSGGTDYAFLREYVDALPPVIQGAPKYGFKLPPGLKPAEVGGLEKLAGTPLPAALLALFQETYGAEMGGYWLLTAQEIHDARRNLSRQYPAGWRPAFIPFIQLEESEDFLVLDPARADERGCAILDAQRELRPATWPTICYGLRTWLRRMVAEDFSAYWLPSS